MMILKNPVQGKHQTLLPEAVHQEAHLEAVYPAVHLEAVHLEAVHPAVHLEAVHPAVHLEAVYPAAHQGAVHPAVHQGAVHPAVHPKAAHPADHLRDREEHLDQNHHQPRNRDHLVAQQEDLHPVVRKAALRRDLNVALLDDEGYFWALKLYQNSGL
jgi:hypothetical protein